MANFPLLLFATQSLALQFNLPSSFGGKTEFSDKGWRALIDSFVSDVSFGIMPTKERNLEEEPTCIQEYPYCSTTIFGNDLTLETAKSATLWVKWHQDVTPFGCDTEEGCTITSATSVADLSSQTTGWSVQASFNGKIGTNNDKPTVNADLSTSITVQYSNSAITSNTQTSTRTLKSKCSQGHLCFLQTGTLMMALSGSCRATPLIHCGRTFEPCTTDKEYVLQDSCQQWSDYANKHCNYKTNFIPNEQCSFNVAVRGQDNELVTFQVFEQKPIASEYSLEKRDFVPPQSPFGELSDGSSGAWLAWKQ